MGELMMPLRTHQREPANLSTVRWDSVSQPRIRNAALSAVLYFLLWGYAAFAISSSFAAPVGKFDDAIPLLHGMLVQQGYIPNLDFYSFYPPLNLYLNAAAFKLLGRTVIAARAVGDILYLIVLILVTWLFRSGFRSYGPLVPAAVLVVATSIGAGITLPVWPGFAISLSAVLVYLCSYEVERYRIWLVGLSGLLAALGILSRINFGCYAVMVIGLDFLRRLWLDSNRADRVRLRNELTTVAAFTIPLITCCLCLCMWIYGSNIGVALSQFIVTAQRLMAVRGFIRLRLEPDLACAVALPSFWFFFRVLKGAEGFEVKQFLSLAFGVCVLLLALGGGNHTMIAVIVTGFEVALVVFLHVFIRRLEAAEFSFLIFFCGILHYYLSRADGTHWHLLPVAGALLMPYFFMSAHDPVNRRFEPSASAGAALSVMTAAIFVFLATPSIRPGFTALPNGLALMANFIHNPHSTDSDRILAGAPAPGWDSVYPDRDELAALRYLRERTNSSTPLFVGVRDHSMLFWNDLRMYWLAERPIAVRSFQLETKVATEEAFQREIADDLERNKRAWVILDSAKEGDAEFSRSHYKGSDLLDNYIAQNFREEAKFGRYVILTRGGD
jgi:hypothetical protein